MMSQTFSKKKVWVSTLLLLPVAGLCVLLFNQAIVAQEKEKEKEKELAITGDWLNPSTEYLTASIYENRDTLWYDQHGTKFQIKSDNNSYYLESSTGRHKVIVNEDGNLNSGGLVLIPKSKGIKQTVLGTWENIENGDLYSFSLSNGALLCDITSGDKNPVRYYPILKDHLVTFTLGERWISFKREGGFLIDELGTRYKVISKPPRNRYHTKVFSTKFSISGNPVEMIQSIHPTPNDLREWQDEKRFHIFLDEQSVDNKEILEYQVDDLAFYTISELEEQTRIDIWTTPFWQMKNSSYSKDDNELVKEDYITRFLSGAAQNGKKALVIEIKNDKITINGKQSTLATFSKDVDAITKDWEETDYTDPVLTYMVKGNSENFLKKLETEYTKTYISRANGGAGLIPPPPPVAPKNLENIPPPPPSPSVEDHLFKMNRLGGEFYYNDTKITYAKAQKLIEDYKDLNVKTPYPYSTPPQTFLTKQPKQKPKLKIGDTLTVTVTETGEKHKMVLKEEPTDHATRANVKRELEKVDKLNLKYTSQKPATKKEIAIYNKLATKYNKNPEGIIKQGEVIRMYDIYSRMTPRQKKAAQPYPVLPPPPPPAPEKLNPGDTLTITINDTGEKHQVIKEETKKDTVNPKFKFQNISGNDAGVEFSPKLSVYPEKKFPETVDKISYKTRPSDGLRFFEGERELTPDEAMLKMNSADYFTDIGDVIPGTTKKKVVFTKKPWIGNDTNSQSNFKAIVTFENSPDSVSRLKNVIEQHALSKGLFEIEGKIISKEKALEIVNQPNVGLEVTYLNTLPYKLILHKQ